MDHRNWSAIERDVAALDFHCITLYFLCSCAHCQGIAPKLLHKMCSSFMEKNQKGICLYAALTTDNRHALQLIKPSS